MIDAKLKGNELGRIIYNQLKKLFRTKNSKRIRIALVYDYEKNVLGFLGKVRICFFWRNTIRIDINLAIKMYKNI